MKIVLTENEVEKLILDSLWDKFSPSGCTPTVLWNIEDPGNILIEVDLNFINKNEVKNHPVFRKPEQIEVFPT